MRRPLVLSAIALALWIAAIWASGGMAAVGTQPVGSVRIQDGFHTQLLRIDHNGAATVTCMTAAGVAESCGGSGGGGDAVNVFHQSTVRHVSSVLHARLIPSDNANDIVAMHIVGPMNRGLGAIVAHGGGLQTVLSNAAGTLVTVTGTSLDVNCTGCSAASVVNVAHISAQIHARLIPSSNANDIVAMHIVGPMNRGLGAVVAHGGGLQTVLSNAAGTLVTVTGTSLDVNCTGCSAASVVNVAHISAQVHARLIPSSNANDVIAVHGGMAQSGTWTIQAAHQGGQWNIAHVTSVVHVAGVVHLQSNLVDSANNALRVTGVTVFTIMGAVDHISSRVHAVLIPSSNANDQLKVHGAMAQSGSWSIQAAHQGGEWNIRHVSSALHIAGTINGAAFHVQGLGIPGQAHGGVLTIQGITGGVPVPISGTITAGDAVNVFHQSTIRHISSEVHALIRVPQGYALHVAAFQGGSWTVQAAHQGGEWNVRHMGARLHAVIIPSSNANDVLAMHIQDAGTNCTTCRARVDHYNMLVVQPHISGALRTWQVTSCGTSASLAINTNANRRDLWVMNRGNGNIYIGYGTTGHVALTTANGWPLHATASAVTTTARHSTALSTVYLQNYQGPLACISDLAGQTLQVMEILR